MIIHPSSIVDPKAKIGVGVKIGPFCCVGGDVVLNDHVELISHISVSGITEIGEKTKIYPFASIGHPPQDLKYSGEASRTIIGSN
ncbi:MAG: acyl-[acyl-carrier-protein]--UDP-N-acetylglucosamine O-acyltransferase, partial [Alphaproteobacteria bacterium]